MSAALTPASAALRSSTSSCKLAGKGLKLEMMSTTPRWRSSIPLMREATARRPSVSGP